MDFKVRHVNTFKYFDDLNWNIKLYVYSVHTQVWEEEKMKFESRRTWGTHRSSTFYTCLSYLIQAPQSSSTRSFIWKLFTYSHKCDVKWKLDLNSTHQQQNRKDEKCAQCSCVCCVAVHLIQHIQFMKIPSMYLYSIDWWIELFRKPKNELKKQKNIRKCWTSHEMVQYWARKPLT